MTKKTGAHRNIYRHMTAVSKPEISQNLGETYLTTRAMHLGGMINKFQSIVIYCFPIQEPI